MESIREVLTKNVFSEYFPIPKTSRFSLGCETVLFKHKETARGLRPLTVHDEPSNNDETRRECITTP